MGNTRDCMLGSALKHFRDVTILVSAVLLCHMKIYLISYHMQLKVSIFDFCI